MKKNLYTQAMKNITAPQSLVDETLSKLNTANGEIIAIEKPKRRALKFTSAVAAVLALIIGLSVIPFGGDSTAPDSEHNFVITVGAAEIKPDVYVEIGELSNSGSGASFKAKGEIDLDNFDGCGEFDIIRIDRMFLPHELSIQGENIESITYTAHNCRLAYDSQFEGIVDIEELSNEELTDGEGVIHYYNKYLWAKSCTFDYQSQLDSIASGKWYGIPKIGVEFAFEFEEGEHTIFIEEKNMYDESLLFEQEFNAHADEFSLDVIANFKDGEKAIKTLKFKCVNDNGRLLMYATET